MSNEKLEGKMYVTKQFPSGSEEQDEQRILVDTFETTPAEVTAKLGMTINLGNYESLRVDVAVTLPCYKEEISQAQQKAFELVEHELFKKVRETKESIKVIE